MHTPLSLSSREIWIKLLLYPSHTLPTAAAPVLVGIGLAVRDRVFAPLPVLIAFLGSWLIHLGGVFTDNYELLRRHPELPEHPELIQAVHDGTLRLSTLRAAIFLCFGLTALTGPYLLAIGGFPVLVIGTIGMLASLCYAGGPWPYARLGLAEPFFLIMFGVVAEVGTYYIQAAAYYGTTTDWRFVLQTLPMEAFVLGLPVGALVTNVLIIDDIRDHTFDAQKGWRTGTVRFGVGWSRIRFSILMALSYIAPFFFWLKMDCSAWIFLPLCTLPMAYTLLQTLLTHDQARDLQPMTPQASRLSLLYSLLLALGIALSPTINPI